MPATAAELLQERTLRAPGFKVWAAPDRNGTTPRTPTNAHVKNTAKLLNAESWTQLQTVRDLIIEDEDDVFKVVPSELASLRSLKSLKFSWSQCKSLPDSMAGLGVRYLSVRENKLQKADVLVHMLRLVYVDLSNNQLLQLPRDIGRLVELQVLNISGNKLKELPQSIGSLAKLQELNCSSNRLRELPVSMGQLHNLRNLDISFNLLHLFPDSMGGMINLTELRATNNQLKDLPGGLHGAERLRHLFLAGNQFSHVPPVLQHLKQLQSVNFRQNFIDTMQHRMAVVTTLLLDGNNLKDIPDALCDCQSLSTLSLQFNEIKVVNPAIGRLRSLRVLYLGGNEFSQVPDELCRLANLRHLSLNSTDIRTLPPMFDTLRLLNFLDLSGSKMIPELQEAYGHGVEGVMKYVKRSRENPGTATRPLSMMTSGRPGSAKDKSGRKGSGRDRSMKRGSEVKGTRTHTPSVYNEAEEGGGGGSGQ